MSEAPPTKAKSLQNLFSKKDKKKDTKQNVILASSGLTLTGETSGLYSGKVVLSTVQADDGTRDLVAHLEEDDLDTGNGFSEVTNWETNAPVSVLAGTLAAPAAPAEAAAPEKPAEKQLYRPRQNASLSRSKEDLKGVQSFEWFALGDSEKPPETSSLSPQTQSNESPTGNKFVARGSANATGGASLYKPKIATPAVNAPAATSPSTEAPREASKQPEESLSPTPKPNKFVARGSANATGGANLYKPKIAVPVAADPTGSKSTE